MSRVPCRKWILISAIVAIEAVGRGDAVFAATDSPVSLDQLLAVLFDDGEAEVWFDLNQDTRFSAADLPALYNRQPVPSTTPTPSVGPSSTPEPSATASSSPTPSNTATPTSNGILFDGPIAALAPVAVGDTLIYRVVDPNGAELTETVRVKSQTAPGQYVVEVTMGDRVVERSEADLGTRLFLDRTYDRRNGTLTTCQPGILELATPLVTGQGFSSSVLCRVTSSYGSLGSFRRDESTLPQAHLEPIVVPAGSYAPTIRLDRLVTLSGYTSGTETHESYLAPGIGVVRHVVVSGSKRTTRELVDGTVGGQSVRR